MQIDETNATMSNISTINKDHTCAQGGLVWSARMESTGINVTTRSQTHQIAKAQLQFKNERLCFTSGTSLKDWQAKICSEKYSVPCQARSWTKYIFDEKDVMEMSICIIIS